MAKFRNFLYGLGLGKIGGLHREKRGLFEVYQWQKAGFLGKRYTTETPRTGTGHERWPGPSSASWPKEESEFEIVVERRAKYLLLFVFECL